MTAGKERHAQDEGQMREAERRFVFFIGSLGGIVTAKDCVRV